MLTKFLASILLLLMSCTSMANTDAPNEQNSLFVYQQQLAKLKTHQFNLNQIKQFVYYWFSLHDRHAPFAASAQLLDSNNLLMCYPEITVHNLVEYHQWYAGVGAHIANNLHNVQKLEVTFLPNHRYQVDLMVNWQGIDKKGNYINIEATQRWILIDGVSKEHPYITRYEVLAFNPI